MPQQKIPLFGGLTKACQDGTSGPLLTPIFTPPDAGLAAGTQSYYAVHLWMRPTSNYVNPPPPPDDPPAPFGAAFYMVTAARGSAPSDRRPVWAGNSYSLNQPAAPTMPVAFVTTGLRSDYGIPVKVLDGYLVRGDVSLEMVIQNAASNAYNNPDPLLQATGTAIWGYYQRVGTDDAWRFIGEPTVGLKFDMGMPIAIAAGERKVIHTFDSSRFDELAIQMVSPLYLDPALQPVEGSSTILSFADENEVDLPHTTAFYLNVQAITGSPNSLRDPQSVYGLKGVFGGNPKLKYLMAKNVTIVTPTFSCIHGRFNRH